MTTEKIDVGFMRILHISIGSDGNMAIFFDTVKREFSVYTNNSQKNEGWKQADLNLVLPRITGSEFSWLINGDDYIG